jgi:hypothetical protein
MCLSLPVYSSVSSEMMMDVSEIHNDREISVVYIRKGSHFLSDLAPPSSPFQQNKRKTALAALEIGSNINIQLSTCQTICCICIQRQYNACFVCIIVRYIRTIAVPISEP